MPYHFTHNSRTGIISVGNWLVDTVKFIGSYPAKGNLVTIERVDVGLGGCAHNVLVDLAKLGVEIPLYAGGCIGNDTNGDFVKREIRRYKIDQANMVVLDNQLTSYTDVMSEIKGSTTRTFFHYRGANALLGPEHFETISSPAKIFHLGYLLLLDRLDNKDDDYGVVAAKVLHDLQEKGYETSVDVVSEEGDRFLNVVLPCLPYVDYFIVNEVEAGACSGIELRNGNGTINLEKVAQSAQKLIDRGIRKSCVIHFPEGGYRLDRTGDSYFEPSIRAYGAEICSAVGAGDAFCAGMLYAFHENFGIKESLIFANTSARFNLRSTTSTGGAPSLGQIKQFIKENYQKQIEL